MDFLSAWTQEVIFKESSSSSCSPIVTPVLQGSVLGPLFSSSSSITSQNTLRVHPPYDYLLTMQWFIKLWTLTKTPPRYRRTWTCSWSGRDTRERHFTQASAWSWLSLVSRKRSTTTTSARDLLEIANSAKYLGQHRPSRSLEGPHWVCDISAQKKLAFLQRNLYKCLIRPRVEYAATYL